MRNYYVYMTASSSGTLYIGMTNDLARRVYEHKNHLVQGFTEKYNCTDLIYFETSSDASTILEREKQLKHWNSNKKIELIKKFNPTLKDLSAGFAARDDSMRRGDARQF